jgi:hypothetical protein
MTHPNPHQCRRLLHKIYIFLYRFLTSSVVFLWDRGVDVVNSFRFGLFPFFSTSSLSCFSLSSSPLVSPESETEFPTSISPFISPSRPRSITNEQDGTSILLLSRIACLPGVNFPQSMAILLSNTSLETRCLASSANSSYLPF